MSDPKRARSEQDPAAGDGDPEVLSSLEALARVQVDLEKINDEASDKVLEVEQQFNKKRRPKYVERNQLIGKIPEFWRKALTSHPVLRATITEDEENVLGYLTEVDVEDAEDIKSGYKIVFKFSPNPFFSNTKLEKSLKFADDASLTIEGDVPLWKPGKEPAEALPAGSGKRQAEVEYNFFKWFVDYERLEGGDHDDIADIIKDDIWPDPLKYYNGEIEGLEAALQEDDEKYEEGSEGQDDDEYEGDEEFADEGADDGEGEGGD